jgi:hypothetical protein
VVLGLGSRRWSDENGIVTRTTASAKGILISGILFDAGTTNSPALLQFGSGHARSDNFAPTPTL